MPAPVRHLAVEATRLTREQRGIGRYVRNLLREFATLDASLRVTLYVANDHDSDTARTLLHALHPGYVTRGDVQHIDHLPHSDAEVAWYPWNFITTPTTRARRVVTIHDLAPMLLLDHRWWKILKRAKYRRRYHSTVQQAHGIIADSAFGRRELQQHLGVDPTRVAITLLGADDLALDEGHDDTPLRAHGVDGPYFLAVGAHDGRKNMRTLYRAMELLWMRGERVRLVCGGPSISRETRDLLGRAPWLTHVGYVSDVQLATLYRGAVALVFPSRYEGFGLPAAEAMRAGTPVVCAQGSAVAEVVGPAGVLVPWHDAYAFAAEMSRLVEHPLLRTTLAARGRVQASRFTWAQSAAATLRVFTQVLGDERLGGVPAPSAAMAASALTSSAPPGAASRERDILKA